MKRTLFEMEETPEVLDVQRRYMGLAERMLENHGSYNVEPLDDTEIFNLLGFD
jgi:light-independent protochlorophyllide reductase subunit L